MGAYSPGVKVTIGDAEMLFVTGQIALDEAGGVMYPNDAAAQAERVFVMVGAILEAAGMSFADVVKAQIFLTNIADFSKVSPIRSRYFADSRPVSTLVEVKGLVKPGCCVEVEVIAVKQRL